MSPEEVQRIVDNEREWRTYMLTKIDMLDKELASFKLRVFAMATILGGSSGALLPKILKVFGVGE